MTRMIVTCLICGLLAACGVEGDPIAPEPRAALDGAHMSADPVIL